MIEFDAREPMGAEPPAQFRGAGAVLLRNFYDPVAEIAPIKEGIRRIVAIAAEKYGVAADCSSADSAMTLGYRALIAADRSYGSEVYDAVKQIPALLRLVAHEKNEALCGLLSDGYRAGVAAGGYGVRIDNPHEDRFRARWHQEFPAQLRSLDGLVFWSPLLTVTAEMGPVQVLPGSHAEGYLEVHEDSGSEAGGAYGLVMNREREILDRYAAAAPLLRPGDLLVMNFLTVHQSGRNVSDRPRWSMQFRYFNFDDPTGRRLAWRGSFAAGNDFHAALAALAAEDGKAGSDGEAAPIPSLAGQGGGEGIA